MTTHVERLAECDHLLLYLTSQTWTRGEEASGALATVILRAMDLGVHVLLAHESGPAEHPNAECHRHPHEHQHLSAR